MREPKPSFVTFNFHSDLCVGCGACVGACLDEKNNFDLVDPPLRRLYRHESLRGGKVQISYYSLGCLHCEAHPCVAACPQGCYTVDAASGTVQLDASRCVGCHACEQACPHGSIVYTHEGIASKCDGCRERLQFGMLPRCVDACPRLALVANDRTPARRQAQAQLAKDLKSKKLIGAV